MKTFVCLLALVCAAFLLSPYAPPGWRSSSALAVDSPSPGVEERWILQNKHYGITARRKGALGRQDVERRFAAWKKQNPMLRVKDEQWGGWLTWPPYILITVE